MRRRGHVTRYAIAGTVAPFMGIVAALVDDLYRKINSSFELASQIAQKQK
jgi:hypothetical protein